MGSTGYSDEPIVIADKPLKSVPINEQETTIGYMRDEKCAYIYTSDSTQITKLDKLCKQENSPYSLVEDTGYGKRYLLKDKGLISFRAKKREISDEQKALAAERFRKYHADKNSDNQ